MSKSVPTPKDKSPKAEIESAENILPTAVESETASVTEDVDLSTKAAPAPEKPVQRERMLPLRDQRVNAKNLVEASIKNNQDLFLDFDFKFRIPQEEIPEYRQDRPDANIEHHHFVITRDEARFLLSDDRKYNPWFDDGMRAIRFTGSGIEEIPTYYGLENGVSRFAFEMRYKDLEPLIKQALELPLGCTLGYTREVERSAEMKKPMVNETIDDQAYAIMVDPINRQNGIEEQMDRVRNIAKNSSNGQDDPVKVTFYRDDARSLYWNIQNETTNRRVMNGGIIWHGEADGTKGEYSIHT